MPAPAPKTLRVPLSQPVTDLDRTFNVLDMRTPTIADIRDWVFTDPRTVDEFVALAARLADVTPQALHRLPPRDAFRIADVLGPFFDPRVSTGGTSPASAPGDTAGAPTSSAASDSTS